MKVISRTGLVIAACVLAAAAAMPAHAGCSTSGYTIGASGPPYHYIKNADGSDPSLGSISGRFWLLGNKATHNNGGYSSSSWIFPGGGGAYVGADWGGSILVLGCPNAAEGGPVSQPTRNVLHLQTPREWSLSCIVANSSGAYDYAPLWTGGPSGSDLASAVTCPKVVSSVRGPGSATVTLAPVSLTSGIYVDAGDGPCSAFKTAVQNSVKIWRQCVPLGSAAPSATPFPGLWTQAQNPQLPGTGITFSCATPQECYTLTSANVDGEEVPGCVSTAVECNTNLADRPGFKTIKKPVTKR